MAVVRAPVRQQSYLTEYDKLLAEQLRRMSGSIGPGDIAAESYGGKFPVGTMTAKILGSVLARASDRRAMNREEQSKESYSRAFEIAKAMERGNNLSTTGMSVSPEGNLEILPTNVEGGGVSTFTRPETYGETLKNYKSSGIADEQFFEDREKILAEESLAAQFARDNPNKLTGRRVPGVEATTEAPLGIPYAPQNVALTVGEEIPEDKSAISTFLSGTLPQKVLPTNAEQALSQALRGADVNELEFRDYMQNRMVGKPPKYSTPFMLYGSDGSKNTVMTKQNSNGTMEIVDINQNKFNQQPDVNYSLDASKIDTSKPYKIFFTDGSEPVTKSGYIKDGNTYIQWNGKETLVTDIPNVANVEPTSLAKGNTFNIGAKDNKFQEMRASKTAEKWTNWETTAYQAQEDINLIDTAMALFAQDSTPEGITAPVKATAVRIINAVNPSANLTEDSNTQLVLSLINEATLASVKRLTGPISEKELKFLQTLQADLGNSKEANASILLYKKMLARKGANWNSYIESKGGEPGTYQEANKMFREYNNQFTQKYGEGAQGFFNFAKTEAEIEVAALKQQLDDKKITLDEYKAKASYIVNNKYQLPYLKNSLGF